MQNGSLYFPERLHSRAVKITNFTPKGFFAQHKQVEVFYSVRDGNINDVSIFQNVGVRVGKSITQRDDVYIRNNIVFNQTMSVNNLFVSGVMVFDSTIRNITILGKMEAPGTVNMSNQVHTILLYAERNYINPALFVKGTGQIGYVKEGFQWILPINHHNLYITGGPRRVEADLSVAAQMYCIGNTVRFDLEFYNAVILGPTSFINDAWFYKSNSGSILFGGRFQVDNSRFYFTGNPTVECRGGLNLTNVNGGNSETGTGAWSFTTNSQDIDGSNNFVTMNGPVSVVGAITISNYANSFIVVDVLNGTTGSSTWLNRGTLVYATLNAADNSMLTGVLNLTSFANTMGFSGNYSCTFNTTLYATMWNLVIAGTGVKSLGINTTLLGGFSVVSAFAQLDLGTYNITMAGACFIGGSNQATPLLIKASGGSIVIGGLYTITAANVDFSGNPSVELKGGFDTSGNTAVSANTTGTGTWSFTTNNQSLKSTASGASVMGCAILIVGAITLTVPATSTQTFVLMGTLDGNNVSSTFDNRGLIDYRNGAAPMSTGVLQCNAAANTFKYNDTGNQDVTGTTYRTLEFGGSGVKKLLGNVVVNTTAGGSWSITGTATIDYNGFSITTI